MLLFLVAVVVVAVVAAAAVAEAEVEVKQDTAMCKFLGKVAFNTQTERLFSYMKSMKNMNRLSLGIVV